MDLDGSSKYDMLFKLVLVGDMWVGKSSLMLRFADDTYLENTRQTIGVDFKIKTIWNEGKTVKLQIWDTAGQERYRAFSTSFFRGAHGIILVYSITDQNSFDSIPSWIQTIKRNTDIGANILLVANKSDMSTERVVSEAAGRKLAEESGVSFIETSAKNSSNVHQAFITMATQIQTRVGNSLPVSENMADSFYLQSHPVDQTYCCSYI